MCESQCITTRISWPQVDPQDFQLLYWYRNFLNFGESSFAKRTEVFADAQTDIFMSKKYAQNFGLIAISNGQRPKLQVEIQVYFLFYDCNGNT